MRLIIELPWLNENCKSQAKYAYKNVVSPTNLLNGKPRFIRETLYRSGRKS